MSRGRKRKNDRISAEHGHTDGARLTVRDGLQASIGFGLYFLSWFLLTLLPLLFLGVMLYIPGPRVSLNLMFIALLCFGAVLVGLLLRWFARGIVESRRIRSVVVALCAFALGWKLLFSLARFGVSVGQRAWGIVLIVGAITLVWTVSVRDSHRET